MKLIMIVTDSARAIEDTLLYVMSIVSEDAARSNILPLTTSIDSIESVKTI